MRDLVRALPMSSVSFLLLCSVFHSCTLSHGLSRPTAVLDPADQNGIDTNYLMGVDGGIYDSIIGYYGLMHWYTTSIGMT